MGTDMLYRAIALAVQHHGTALDKSGELYLLHPLYVMERVAPHHDLMTIAVLHDLIEDTEISVRKLQSLRFPDHVVEAVVAMTRHIVEGDTLVPRQFREGDKKEVYSYHRR